MNLSLIRIFQPSILLQILLLGNASGFEIQPLKNPQFNVFWHNYAFVQQNIFWGLK